MVISSMISQMPRFNRNIDRSFLVLLVPVKKIEVPARKTNTGAQKWVINLVKKSMGVVVVGIGWIGSHGRRMKKITHMIECHNDHDDPAKDIDRVNSFFRNKRLCSMQLVCSKIRFFTQRRKVCKRKKKGAKNLFH
jgi:hypothetical protein